ncbi:hypothetical protein ES705_43317 [subsurface metagenome]
MAITDSRLAVLRHRHLDPGSAEGETTESTFETPCDVAALQAIEIYKIVVDTQGWTVAASFGTPKIEVSVSTKQGQSLPPKWSGPGTLFHGFQELYLIQAVTGAVGGGAEIRPAGMVMDYNPPLTVADKTLSFYTFTQAMNDIPGYKHVAVFYKLIKLNQAEYIAAMSIMEGL